MTQRTVHIVIGCDTDPDRVGFLDGVPTDTLTWRGMLEGIPLLKQRVSGCRDSDGRSPMFTWLLRVDEQVKRVHGEYAWVLRTHGSFLEELERSGDELGWHPHFWRFDEAVARWYQEAKDVAWQIDMLKQAHADYMRVLPGRAKSVRMGWDYHNNDTLHTLDALGVSVDFSALPGLRTLSASISRHPENLFDWYPTPRRAYKPSTADYRIPAPDRLPSLGLIEAPATVSTSYSWGLIAALQLARKMKDAGHITRWLRRPTYWINLTAKPKYFSPIIGAIRSGIRNSAVADSYFITYFHPDELLENKSGLYDLESAARNITAIVDLCTSEGAKVKFAKAAELPALMAGSLD